MSLDVTLTLRGQVTESVEVIYIREDGATRAITLAEWQERWPDTEPIIVLTGTTEEVYSANITHNLGKMADAAGIYEALWRPEEIGITHARQLIEQLTAGYTELLLKPDFYREYNPPNGWGTYEGLVKFVKNYLDACHAYPDAEVSVSR